ncbi:MAG: hypothetical protein ACON4J_08695 [Parvibaculales bacterium]
MQQSGVQKELGFSLSLHMLVLAAGMVYLPTPSEFLIPENALPIELVSIEEFTRLSQPEAQPEKISPKLQPKPQSKPQSKPQQKPEPAQVKQPEVTAPPPPVQAAPSNAMPPLETAKSKPQPDPKPEAEAFVTLVAQPRPLARPVPVPEPEPAKTFLDTNALQALLDKTPDEPQQPPPAADPVETLAPLSLSEIDAFRAQMKSCWSVPVGAANADDLAVRVELGLNRDGSLAYGPFVVDKSRISDPYFRAAAESVLRAIRRCQPFTMPADKYRSWQKLDLNFDPKQMFGG